MLRLKKRVLQAVDVRFQWFACNIFHATCMLHFSCYMHATFFIQFFFEYFSLVFVSLRRGSMNMEFYFLKAKMRCMVKYILGPIVVRRFCVDCFSAEYC